MGAERKESRLQGWQKTSSFILLLYKTVSCTLVTRSKRRSPRDGVCGRNFSFWNLNFVLELEKQPFVLPWLWIELVEAAKKFLYFRFFKKHKKRRYLAVSATAPGHRNLIHRKFTFFSVIITCQCCLPFRGLSQRIPELFG